MLRLKLQYFGHLTQRAYSMEKILMLGKIEGRRRREWQRIKLRLDGITDSTDMSLSKLQELVKDSKTWRAAVHGFEKSICFSWLNNNSKHLEWYQINVILGRVEKTVTQITVSAPWLTGRTQTGFQQLRIKGGAARKHLRQNLSNQRSSSRLGDWIKKQMNKQGNQPPEIKGLQDLLTPWSCQTPHVKCCNTLHQILWGWDTWCDNLYVLYMLLQMALFHSCYGWVIFHCI